MSDWKTLRWYQTRENLVQRIRSNPELDLLDQRILEELVGLLLPYAQGGEYMRELYPGIYEERSCDLGELKKKCHTSATTLWRHLSRLIDAGLFEDRVEKVPMDCWPRAKYVKHMRAMPLLLNPGRISFQEDFPISYQ